MAATIEAEIGADVTRTLTLRTTAGNAVTSYTSAATLAAKCWQGDDQANLFSPSVAWNDPSAGTIELALAGSQTASLAAGRYKVLLEITASGRTAKGVVAILALGDSPGSATTPPVYGTLKDMEDLATGWIDDLMSLDINTTNFLNQRALARQWLDR